MHVFSFNKEMFPQLLHSYHKSLRYFVLPKFILTLLFCTLYLRKDQFNIDSLVLHREHLLQVSIIFELIYKCVNCSCDIFDTCTLLN